MGSFPATLKLASSYWQKSLDCVELGRAAYVSGRISIVLAVNGCGHEPGHDHGQHQRRRIREPWGALLCLLSKRTCHRILRSGRRLREAARFFVVT
jgi:hypothetical protein